MCLTVSGGLIRLQNRSIRELKKATKKSRHRIARCMNRLTRILNRKSEEESRGFNPEQVLKKMISFFGTGSSSLNLRDSRLT
jgi:hypothetical protein